MARFALLAVALMTACAPAYGADERKIIDAMSGLKAAWERAIAERWPIIWKCGDNGYAVFRPKTGTVQEFDIRKSDSLIRPYVGFINMKIVFEDNSKSPKANGGKDRLNGKRICFRTIQEAFSNNTDADFTEEFRPDNPIKGATVTYALDRDALRMTGVNGGILMPLIFGFIPRDENDATWRTIARHPIN